MPHSTDEASALTARLHQAVAAGKLSASAAANIRRWLTEAPYAPYAGEVAAHIQNEKWQTLDDVFWRVLPFGTGGRRGRMYPIGCGAINERTIAESAAAVALYVGRQQPEGSVLECAIAYDARRRSREFAQLCAEVMATAGFRVFFLDGCRSTPELSFAVRYKQCDCGLMITASHNPPSDNALKVYGRHGGQLLAPHDQGVIDCLAKIGEIRRTPWSVGLASGQIVLCQEEVDRAYLERVVAEGFDGPRRVKIVYSPMHGAGTTNVVPVLARSGFEDVEVFALQAAPDPDFTNVPGHIANPEDPHTFEPIVARAEEIEADLALSTDPDSDRLGCAAPIRRGGPWRAFTGNQIGALLTEHVLAHRQQRGRLTPQHYVVKTLVTSELIRRIATSYGVTTHGDLPVGFKHIGGLIDRLGPEHFVLGLEESHGFLAGDYARDKDAAVAALFMASLAAEVKAAGQSLHDKLDALYWQHGCHVELQYSQTMPGAEGMGRIHRLMATLRENVPERLAGIQVSGIRDYAAGHTIMPGRAPQPLVGPSSDLLIIDLAEDGNYVAVRPSGTEPKVKFYLFAYRAPELLADLASARAELEQRLKQIGQELFALAAVK